MPTQIGQDAAAAFLRDDHFKRDNTAVSSDGEKTYLLLHGNIIAQKMTGRKGMPVIEIRGTYTSQQAQDRLNALLCHQPDNSLRVVNWAGKLLMEKYHRGKLLRPLYELTDKWVTLKEVTDYYKAKAEQQDEKEKPHCTEPRKEKRIRRTKRPTDRKGVVTLALCEATGITEPQSKEILQAFNFDLRMLSGASPSRIQRLQIKGIGMRTSEKIIGALQLGKELAMQHSERDKVTSPADVADVLMPLLRYEQTEIVCVLCLDTKGGISQKGIIAPENYGGVILREAAPIFRGTLNASVFHPREIFRFAIDTMANSIVIAHNHPSGDPQPSQEDIRATKQLIEAGNQIGIKMLDHIIIGDGIFVSLKEEGFIG